MTLVMKMLVDAEALRVHTSMTQSYHYRNVSICCNGSTAQRRRYLSSSFSSMLRICLQMLSDLPEARYRKSIKSSLLIRIRWN
jgi:hypothetical protein